MKLGYYDDRDRMGCRFVIAGMIMLIVAAIGGDGLAQSFLLGMALLTIFSGLIKHLFAMACFILMCVGRYVPIMLVMGLGYFIFQ